jgi:hypothetical protein
MRGGVGWMFIRGIFPRLLTGRLAAREGRSRRHVVKIPVIEIHRNEAMNLGAKIFIKGVF